jgi:hypothetical protein
MEEANALKEKAADFIESNMPSSKSYPAPTIPKTPSASINKMLDTRCNHKFDNPGKAAIAYVVCYVFQAITFVYNQIMAKTQQVCLCIFFFPTCV